MCLEIMISPTLFKGLAREPTARGSELEGRARDSEVPGRRVTPQEWAWPGVNLASGERNPGCHRLLPIPRVRPSRSILGRALGRRRPALVDAVFFVAFCTTLSVAACRRVLGLLGGYG